MNAAVTVAWPKSSFYFGLISFSRRFNGPAFCQPRTSGQECADDQKLPWTVLYLPLVFFHSMFSIVLYQFQTARLYLALSSGRACPPRQTGSEECSEAQHVSNVAKESRHPLRSSYKCFEHDESLVNSDDPGSDADEPPDDDKPVDVHDQRARDWPVFPLMCSRCNPQWPNMCKGGKLHDIGTLDRSDEGGRSLVWLISARPVSLGLQTPFLLRISSFTNTILARNSLEVTLQSSSSLGSSSPQW